MNITNTEIEETKFCKKCGHPVLPTGIWKLIDGFCECIFSRI
jgi:hypothetical protein